jgi:peptidoglycan/LPS O-acetylase OafA/YrhL
MIMASEKGNNVTYDDLYKYRSVWMGIAILWIIYYHFPHDFITNPLLLKLQLYGYAGVDMFLFASGIGCYYSLNRDVNPLGFMKRRLKRILPPYWFFLIMWSALKLIQKQVDLKVILGNFLGVQYFSSAGIAFNWYIGLLFVFYILAPVLFELVKGVVDPLKYVLLTALMILFTVPFIGDQGYLIAFSRLPVFFIGMCFGKAGVTKRSVSKKDVALITAAGFLGVVVLYIVDRYFYSHIWETGLAWYVFMLIAPSLCLLISCVSDFVSKAKPGKATLSVIEFLGKYSFELFMAHLFVIDLRAFFVEKKILADGLWTWWSVIIFSVPLALILGIPGRVIGNNKKI